MMQVKKHEEKGEKIKMDLFVGKTDIRTRKKREARNKLIWSARKNADPFHRKSLLMKCTVISRILAAPF